MYTRRFPPKMICADTFPVLETTCVNVTTLFSSEPGNLILSLASLIVIQPDCKSTRTVSAVSSKLKTRNGGTSCLHSNQTIFLSNARSSRSSTSGGIPRTLADCAFPVPHAQLVQEHVKPIASEVCAREPVLSCKFVEEHLKTRRRHGHVSGVYVLYSQRQHRKQTLVWPHSLRHRFPNPSAEQVSRQPRARHVRPLVNQLVYDAGGRNTSLRA